MYLLFVDESGTHGGSPAFVLGGAAIHEDDTQRLQQDLDDLVCSRLGHVPSNLDEYELHAGEMRNAKKPLRPDVRASIWATFPRSLRLELLRDAYRTVVDFVPCDPEQPVVLFGVVVDARFRATDPQVSRERFAYEVLLNKFDLMLKRSRLERARPNRGLVVHDRRVVAERDIQTWTAQWRSAAGSVGQLRHLADVPLFADSRATRLLQVADLVSYALFRQFSSQTAEHPEFDLLWPAFHSEGGITHGCVHFTPSFGQGSCACRPCEQRLLAEATQRRGPTRRIRHAPVPAVRGTTGTNAR